MSVDPAERAPMRAGISLQSRITVVAMITAVAVLAAASAAFIGEHWRAARASHAELQRVVTSVVSAGPSLAAAVKAPARGSALFDRLRGAYPELSGVYLIDRDGRILVGSGPASLAEAAVNHREVRVPVQVDGHDVGALVTFTAKPSIWGAAPRYLALTAALFFAASGLALFLGRWLAGRVTEPVDRLSRVMRAVAGGGDFAQRVERTADDELGRLTDSFNDLLAKLNQNDQALRRTMFELVDAKDSAESANRLKSQFLANMSHEIRTPLNGLLAMAQVMALDDLGAAQRARLDVIRQSGQALLTILNDVLDVSKIEAGKLELEVEAFDAEAVFRPAHAAFSPVALKKGLTLELDIRSEALGQWRGDAARLRQIFDNLVANALKFTSQGSVRVTLSGLGEGGGEGLSLAVADTGIGIEPESLPQLFQTFTQADSSTTRRFGGTGLGLSICHELVELMGGRITVDSRPGEGSTFTVALSLPRVAAPAPSPAEDLASEESGEERTLKVLAAEDNPTNQLVLTTVMGIFGVDLTLVDDGRKAVDAWRDGDFDLILMDIQMPEMDGLAATRAIRLCESETGRTHTPIIALSAHAMTHQVKEYLQAGFDLHVAKPIELPRLQAAMAEAVARTRTPGAATAGAAQAALV